MQQPLLPILFFILAPFVLSQQQAVLEILFRLLLDDVVLLFACRSVGQLIDEAVVAGNLIFGEVG